MHNQISKYLCHMNSQEKAAYNRDYYRRNKDYWVKWRKEHSAPTPTGGISRSLTTGRATEPGFKGPVTWGSSPEARKAWENAQKSNRPDYYKTGRATEPGFKGPVTWDSSPEARKAWENTQKSNRPDYYKLGYPETKARMKSDAAALSSAKKQNWAYAEGMRRKERSKQLASDLGKNAAALSGWDAIDTANRIAAKTRGRKTPVASVNLEDLANERNMSKIAKTVRSVKRSLRSASEAFKGDWQRGASDLIKLGKQIKDAWCNN